MSAPGNIIAGAAKRAKYEGRAIYVYHYLALDGSSRWTTGWRKREHEIQRKGYETAAIVDPDGKINTFINTWRKP